MTQEEHRIGEVLESSTTEFIAQCDALHAPPPFGSLVAVREGDLESYAFVAYAETVGMDPGRRPVARGIGLPNEEEVYRRHPELSKLLHTLFRAVVVAHRDRGALRPYLPPTPARVHAFVHPATKEAVRALGDVFELVAPLLLGQDTAQDELAAAAARFLAEARPDREAYLVQAGRRLTLLLRGDVSRLQSLLPKIRP